MRIPRTAFFSVAWLLAWPAHAQTTANERSVAESLFSDAKQLMAKGNYDQACPKLEESQRLDPAGGTLLNLALCHEKQGKVASAWSEFKEAASVAKRDGREERATAAREHVKALEPKLPWLTLNVAAPVEGEEVKLDGAAIGRAGWGTAVAIDPGTHELRATAPGKKDFSASIAIAVAEKKSVSVPLLEDAPSSAATPPAPVETKSEAEQARPSEQVAAAATPSGHSRTLGWVIGGVGVVATGVGVYFGIDTLSKNKQSRDLCPTNDTCTPHGAELSDQAHTSAWISNIGIGLGIVGIGVGTYMVLTGHGGEAHAARLGPLTLDAAATTNGGSVRVRGTW